jgi:ribosome-binding factor A
MVQSVVGEAILSKLHDPRISPFASVTRVEVAADLQVADVHVSVLGNPGEARRTMAGLTSAAGRIQSMLARTLQTRQCPKLRFHLDDSLKKGMETMRLIDESMAEIRTREESGEPRADQADTAPPQSLQDEPRSDPPSTGGSL